MSYSEDYRTAAIEYKKNGHTFKELKKVFKITPRTYYKWLENLESTGKVVVKVKRTRRRKIDNDILKKALEEKPDSYLRELTKLFNCSTTAVHKRLVLLDLTYKKRLSHTRKNAKKLGHNILKK
jgi:transposase